jgi:hypothetical protein
VSWLAKRQERADRRRERNEQRRRRAAVAKRSIWSDWPLEVQHALDYFIWSALDDRALEPHEPRPFGDDERHYNAILNSHFDIDAPSTAQSTWPRVRTKDEPRPEGAVYVPYYFPDEDPYAVTTGEIAKDSYVMSRLDRRHEILGELAKTGTRVEGRPRLPSQQVLVNPDAYIEYFGWLWEQGGRFAKATADEREHVTILAPMAAVLAPGETDEERLLFTDGWVEVPHGIAMEVIQDFLDPMALLL